ncbi:hypothetical protein [Sphingomicrobium sediminis]|uniref:Uncharacterized protein n=1 Tax=Sphingomicrobium sediminis TaxID=2950949 RepID=A0A9X2ELU5_9SPHN|nr:hypothetical protein [Sphingomicrobium sediminis]MCM8557822.1 hypothetical protein [Sphingomicrobium sediminis]
MHSSDPIIVDSRFQGPDGMGNGGYVSGLVAEAIGGPAKIRLKAPTPLDIPLTLVRDGSGARLMDGDRLLVEGEPLGKPLDLDPLPSPPGAEAIEAARGSFPTVDQHMAPNCFVCGPKRDPDDALHLLTGCDPATHLAADHWVPRPDLADDDGLVAVRYFCAALDCPSYFATGLIDIPALLAGFAPRIERRPQPGEKLTVTGWPIMRDGRKFHSGSVIHDEAGIPIAMARAFWVAPDEFADYVANEGSRR